MNHITKKIKEIIVNSDYGLNREELIQELKDALPLTKLEISKRVAEFEKNAKIMFTNQGVIWTSLDNPELRAAFKRAIIVR